MAWYRSGFPTQQLKDALAKRQGMLKTFRSIAQWGSFCIRRVRSGKRHSQLRCHHCAISETGDSDTRSAGRAAARHDSAGTRSAGSPGVRRREASSVATMARCARALRPCRGQVQQGRLVAAAQQAGIAGAYMGPQTGRHWAGPGGCSAAAGRAHRQQRGVVHCGVHAVGGARGAGHVRQEVLAGDLRGGGEGERGKNAWWVRVNDGHSHGCGPLGISSRAPGGAHSSGKREACMHAGRPAAGVRTVRGPTPLRARDMARQISRMHLTKRRLRPHSSATATQSISRCMVAWCEPTAGGGKGSQGRGQAG